MQQYRTSCMWAQRALGTIIVIITTGRKRSVNGSSCHPFFRARRFASVVSGARGSLAVGCAQPLRADVRRFRTSHRHRPRCRPSVRLWCSARRGAARAPRCQHHRAPARHWQHQLMHLQRRRRRQRPRPRRQRRRRRHLRRRKHQRRRQNQLMRRRPRRWHRKQMPRRRLLRRQRRASRSPSL